MDTPFDLEGLPEPPPAKALRGTRTATVTWTVYKSQDPAHCDICVEAVHEQWEKGGTHAPNRAVFRRSTGGKTTFYCAEHGMEQKQKDQDAKPKRTKESTRR